MSVQLDHANITVVDIERAIEFLKTALPELRVRGSGETDHGDWSERWLHVGTDDLYVCLNTTTRVEKAERKAREETGLNHVGFMVDDVEAIQGKYEAGGFKCSLADEQPSRKRLYVTDESGITWEFIEYLSDDPAVRNDYSI